MKVILCLVFVFVAISTVDATNGTSTEKGLISPLTNTNGIFKLVSKVLDFPHAVWNIRFHFSWKQLRSYITELDTITLWILSYGSDTQKVTLTTETLARLGEMRGMISVTVHKFREVMEMFKLAKTKKQTLKVLSKIAKHIPYIPWKDPKKPDTYSIDYEQQTVFMKAPTEFRTYFSKIETQLPAITLSTAAAEYATANNWPLILTKAIDRLAHLNELAEDLRSIIEMAVDGQISSHVLTAESLKQVISVIRNSYHSTLTGNVEEDTLRTFTLPMTFITHETKETEGEDDSSSYIHLFYFITPLYNRFDYSTIYTLPIPVHNENIWRTYVPTQKHLISNVGQNWAIESDSFECIEDPTTEVIPICFFNEYPSMALDDCSIAIITNKEVASTCPYKEHKALHGKAIQIQPNSWAYSVAETSSINEKCPDKPETSVVFTDTGILSLKSGCKYQITNGPFQGIMPLTVSSQYEIHAGNVLPQKPESAHPISEHFHTYGYIYVIVLMGILFVLVTASVIIYVKIRIQRMTRNRRCHTVRYSRPSPNDDDRQIGRTTARIFLQEISRPPFPALRAV